MNEQTSLLDEHQTAEWLHYQNTGVVGEDRAVYRVTPSTTGGGLLCVTVGVNKTAYYQAWDGGPGVYVYPPERNVTSLHEALRRVGYEVVS